MINRQFLQFAITLAFLTASNGCRDSAKTAPAKPASSVQEPAPTPTPKPYTISTKPPPDPATMVPVKTIQVQPPALFRSDQFPDEGAVEFLVPGAAGQMLHIKLNEKDWYAYVLVQPPGDHSGRLTPGGDESGNRLYALPQTGTYRVVAQHTKRESAPPSKTSIEFKLLTIDDPMVDPGIRLDQISVDFGSFARKEQLALEPYSDFEGYAADYWPSHLAVENHKFKNSHFEFRIMPIAGYQKIFKSDHTIEILQASLRARGKDASTKGLPYPVYWDSGLNLSTRPQFFEGSGWSGLRWVGAFAQDFVCGFGPDGQYLAYVFEGISDDGRLFILLRARVSNLEVGRHLEQECSSKSRTRNVDAFFEKEMPMLFDKEMSAADPASFKPDLDQLDAVIRSLKLRR